MLNWNWLSCYLSGRHDYSAWCEPGTIFLRCVHCGRRSSGWSVDPKPRHQAALPAPPTAAATNLELPATAVNLLPSVASSTQVRRVLPFVRGASSYGGELTPSARADDNVRSWPFLASPEKISN
jgi:hypothetical protein